jgi:hypothetical protein
VAEGSSSVRFPPRLMRRLERHVRKRRS